MKPTTSPPSSATRAVSASAMDGPQSTGSNRSIGAMCANASRAAGAWTAVMAGRSSEVAGLRDAFTARPTLAQVKRIVILGSTGSVGTQALDVVERSDELEVVALAAARNFELLIEQADKHGVARIALADEAAAARASEAWTGGEVLAGAEGLVELITGTGCDLVLNALLGSAGLGPTVAALGEGIDLALANKESLVVGGELVMTLAEATGATIIPVDSEHSALHQLVNAEQRLGGVDTLVLTASGGPFRGRTVQELANVTPEQALAHPTWDMGG